MRSFITVALLFTVIGLTHAQRIVRVAGGQLDGKPALESDVMPYRSAVAADGTIYFLSLNNWTVRKIDPVTSIVSNFAGNGNFGIPTDGAAAISSPLTSLDALEVGPDGLVYIAGGGLVTKVDANGKIVRVAGRTTDPGGSLGDGGPAVNAKLETVTDIVFDSHGNLFIAQGAVRRIRKVDATTNIITTYAGTGEEGSDGDDGPATNAKMYANHLAIDDNDNLYVSDIASNALRMIDPATGIITRFAGNGTNGFSGDGGQALNAQFSQSPRHVAIKGNEMFISDGGSARIRKVILSTGIITTIAGTGSYEDSGDGGPAINAALGTVQDLDFDKNGDLIFSSNGRMRKISGTTITTAAGFGYSQPDGTLALESVFFDNIGLVVMPNGDIIFADYLGNRIRKIQRTTSTVSTIAGTGENGFSGDDGPAIAAKLDDPFGVVMDTLGNIIFSDTGNRRIRKINMINGVISTIAGNGSTGNSGDGGPATSASLASLHGIAFDRRGDLYVPSNSVIRKIDFPSGTITTVAGDGTSGDSGDGGSALNAKLGAPYGVAPTADGSFYIVDRINQSIRKVDPNGIISLFAGEGQGVVKYAGSTGGGVFFRQPSTILFAPNGNLYVSSYGLINRIDMNTNEMYTVAGSILPQGITGDGGPAIDAKLAYPFGLAFNQQGDLFISDSGRGVIRKVVARRDQTITFNALEQHSLNEPSFTITGTMAFSSVSLPLTFESSDPAIASVSGNIVTINKAGTVNITAKQTTGDLDYLPAPSVTQQLVIKKKTQTITFGPLEQKVTGSSPFQLGASATSGLAVSYESSNTSVATVSDNLITIVGIGTTSIIAKQAGDDTYTAAPNVEQSLTVTTPGITVQTITFNTLVAKILGDAPFDLTATSSSGLTMEYTSSHVTIAKVSGNKVTILGAGQVTIKASQPGSAVYAAATSVSQSFCVNPRSPVVTISDPNPTSPKLSSDQATGNQWYRNGNVVTGATSQTYTAPESGSYAAKVIKGTCASELSLPIDILVTSVNEPITAGISVYPTLVKNELIVEVESPTHLRITDMQGRDLMFENIPAGTHFIDVRNYAAGMYLLKATKGVFKFVKTD